MKFITNHIDELLFNFPVNDVTIKMRDDLDEATENDFGGNVIRELKQYYD